MKSLKIMVMVGFLALQGVMVPGCKSESSSTTMRGRDVSSGRSGDRNEGRINGDSEAQDGRRDQGSGSPGIPAESRELRRLTAIEYGNSIKSILGVSIDSELSSFPLEGSVFGFQNSFDAYSAGPGQIEWFASTATFVSAKLVERLASSTLGPCMAGQDFSCAKGLFERYRKLLLRGAEDSAVDGLLAEVERSNLATGTVADALQAKIEVLLQLPSFLYLFAPQLEGARVLSRDENDLAARLSLLIWKSLPDEPMLDAATDKTLLKNYAAHVDSLLDSPKARSGFRSYIKELLFLDRLKVIEASPGYENITEGLKLSMEQETLDFFESIAFNPNKDFMDIFTDVAESMDPDLEAIYNTDAAGNPVAKEDTRKGYLSQASFLTLTSLLAYTDPVARGHYVSKVFFCRDIPNPVTGVTPLEEKTSFTTKKQRYEAHSKNETCASCHIYMDRVGFAFEQFDKTGRLRDRDEYNTIVDDSGVYKFFDEKELPFTDFADFNSKLAGNDSIRRCLVKKAMEYALGFKVDPKSAIFDDVYRDYSQTKKSYVDLLKTIVNSAAFKQVAGS